MDDSPKPQRSQRYQTTMIDTDRWDEFKFRDGDIFICTPPKTGTTWTQMICALLIFQKPELEVPLTSLSPWLEFKSAPIDDVLELLEAQTHRRFIKTHTPLDGIPYRESATYLCIGRDPRDAFMSMDNHMQNMSSEFFKAQLSAEEIVAMKQAAAKAPKEITEKFQAWIADDGVPWQSDKPIGASTVLYHIQSFWNFRHLTNIHLFHYSNLMADLDGEMRRMAAALGIEVDEQKWPELVKAATFESMKAKANDLAPDVDKGVWRDNDRFFNKGSNGQWNAVFTDREIGLYEAAMAQRLEPALAQWLEKGSASLS